MSAAACVELEHRIAGGKPFDGECDTHTIEKTPRGRVPRRAP